MKAYGTEKDLADWLSGEPMELSESAGQKIETGDGAVPEYTEDDRKSDLVDFIDTLRREGIECTTIEHTTRIKDVTVTLKAEVQTNLTVRNLARR